MGRGSAKLKHSSKCALSLCCLRPRRGEYQVTERRGSRNRPGAGGQIPDQAVYHCKAAGLPRPVMDGMSLAAGILNLIHNNRALLECRWASEVTFLEPSFLTSPQSAHHESDSPFTVAQWLQQFLGNGLPQPTLQPGFCC